MFIANNYSFHLWINIDEWWVKREELFSLAEPQSLLSRRADTCERLRSQRGLRPYEERAVRPSVYVERTRSVWGGSARTVLVHLCDLPSRPKVSLRALISEAITPRLNKLRKRIGIHVLPQKNWSREEAFPVLLVFCGRLPTVWQ